MSKLFTVRLLVFLLASLHAVCQAQIAGTRIPDRPEKYYHPYHGMNLGISKDHIKNAVDWIVYSSKEGNQVFSDPGLVHPIGTANFMEAFFATNIETDNAIQVVRYDLDAMDGQGKRFALDAEAIGWMAKSSLILWQTALLHPETKFARKVMTCTLPSTIQQDFNKLKNGARKVIFFDSPNLKRPNDRDSRIYEIFFVFAETDNALLLGKSQTISATSAKSTVLGWVDKDRVTDWSQRMALEPNWDAEAVEERKINRIEAIALSDSVAAVNYKNGLGVTAAQTIWSGGLYEKRSIPSWKRFPIIRQTSEGIAEVVVVSEVRSASGDVLSAERYAEIENQYNRVRDQRRNINLIFVIDGTRSMESYFPSIANAIQSSMNLVLASDNDFKFGVVVYRDYPDESCNRLISQKGMVDKNSLPSLIQWVREITTDGCKDKDKPEAMYHGLAAALRMLGDDAKSSNAIILIGDTGNRIPDERHDPKEIIARLASKRCGLMAFQVWNAHEPTYQHFIDQSFQLIQSSSRIAADAYKDIAITAYTPECVEAGNMGFKMKNSPIPGAIYFAERGGRLPPEQLEKGIIDIIKETNASNDRLLTFLEYHIKGNEYRPGLKTNEGDNFTPAVLMMLTDMGLQKDALDLLVDHNVQFAMKSFVPIQIEGQKHSLYRYVLFLDATELYELLRTISSFLNPEDPRYTVRQNLKNVCKEILRIHYGTDRKLIEEKSLGEIMGLVTGLPSTSDLLKKIRPDDLDDPRKVTDRQLSELSAYINSKKDALEKVAGDSNYFFRSNDHSYYWIPQELLP